MRIINLIDNIAQVNYGIWNAAISTAPHLLQNHGITSELWFPAANEVPTLSSVKMVPLQSVSRRDVYNIKHAQQLNPENTIIVSHGCWRFPTRWGQHLQEAGFKWVYNPHGMLEPWSMTQKKWKKKLYFHLKEKPLSSKADKIRAVSTPELENLKKIYPESQLTLIPNGIETEGIDINQEKWAKSSLNYLFMARLHHKKAIIPLVKAWLNSPQAKDKNACFNIAGPDDGELPQLQSLIEANPGTNINFLGAVYGKEKEQLLHNSHIYLLPSHSEGFPTSVLEAMAYGLVPVISPGCNFPEAFANQKAIHVTPNQFNIQDVLKNIQKMPRNQLHLIADNASEWIKQNYSLSVIADMQAELYRQLITT